MGRLTLSLIRRFRQWERSAQIAVLIALALLVIVILIAGIGPVEIRTPALIGIIGLVLTLQMIVLWANRDLVTPYTAAQRAYLRGDFDAARATLEDEGAAADGKSLTLLGNTYRQLGRLDASETALIAALDKLPDDQFPLYGLGRTLLAQGRYGEAADRLEAALAAGAPDVIRVDLAEAFYRAGEEDRARTTLAALADVDQEPYRSLIVAYMRWRLGDGPQPDAALIRDGIEFWQATAERFAHMPYGTSVAADVQAMVAH